jgi:hypothetical protein
MSTSPRVAGEDLATLKTFVGELKDAVEEIRTKVKNSDDVLKTHIAQSNADMKAIQEKLDANVSDACAKAEEMVKEYQEKLANLSDNDESVRNTLEWVAQSRQSHRKATQLADARRVLPEIVKTLNRTRSDEFSFGVTEWTDKNPIRLYFYFKESRRIAEISDTRDGIRFTEHGRDAKDITADIEKIIEGINIKRLDDANDPTECKALNQKFFEHMKRWLA